MNMRRMISLGLVTASMLSLTGCVTSQKDFNGLKTASGQKFQQYDSILSQCRDKILELESEIENIKVIAGFNQQAEVSDKLLKFTSIKVEGVDAEFSEGTVELNPNSQVKIIVDIMNASSIDLTQYICQGYITYYDANGNYLEKVSTDARFEVASQSVRKGLELSGFETKNANIKHSLTLILKDIYGNEVCKFEKDLTIR